MKTKLYVVLAVDGSPDDRIAARWAAEEADMRHVPLLILHALDQPALQRPLDAELTDRIMSDYAMTAQRTVTDAADVASATAPVEIRLSVRSGQVVPVLLAAVDEACMVVMGSGRRFDPGRVRLGSVATHVSAHAPCPVIVAREPADSELAVGPNAGQIVVGIDGSDVSAAAVEFAFEEASWRARSIVAVHAWDSHRAVWAVDRAASDDLEEAAAKTLAEALSGWSEKFPGIEIAQRVVRAHPVRALLDQSAGAYLLVLGSHGRGRFGQMVLGSVSQSLLRHASTSIAIVRNNNGSTR